MVKDPSWMEADREVAMQWELWDEEEILLG